jgi:hypothetical protein
MNLVRAATGGARNNYLRFSASSAAATAGVRERVGNGAERWPPGELYFRGICPAEHIEEVRVRGGEMSREGTAASPTLSR